MPFKGPVPAGDGTNVMVNNVNVAEIQKFRQAVEADPAQAKKEKMVEVVWRFEERTPQASAEIAFAKGSRHVEVELPAFAGGWGTSPDPIQYCLFGLASCFAVTFAATASAEGTVLTKLKVRARNRMDLRKQIGIGLSNIIESVRFEVEAESPAGRGAVERLLKLAEQRCPGSECVQRAIPLEVHLV